MTARQPVPDSEREGAGIGADLGLSAEHCGEPGAPPPLATKDFPKLVDAPGSYVLER